MQEELVRCVQFGEHTYRVGCRFEQGEYPWHHA